MEDLHVLDERGLPAVRGVSFEVRAGEIVGIAGVDGNGQTELIDALTGLRRLESGIVRVAGEDVTRDSTRERFDEGIGHIPEDRQRRGLVLDFTLAENIGLHDYRNEPNSRFGWLRPSRLIARARRLLKEFDVRGGAPTTLASSLSGGNQQKVVIAREVERDPRVLVAGQPTSGLDVGAIEFVHSRLVEERDEGRAVLLVSLELEEILSLSDRILVIFEGRIVGEYGPDVTEEELGIAMTGGTAGDGRVSVTPPAPTTGDRGGLLAPSESARARRGLPRPARGDGPRLPDRRPRRPHHRPQPDHGLPGDLRGSGVQLAVWADRAGHASVGARPPADAPRRDAADSLRARGRVRVPLRPLQHRRAGPVLGRVHRRALTSGRIWRASAAPLHVAPRHRARASSAARSGAGSPASSAPPSAPTR